MVNLADKVALVTGGGTGVGRAIVHQLADAGCRVIALGRREPKLRETLEAYTGMGEIQIRVGDISSRDDVDAFFADLDRKGTTIDILVNNAGINLRDRALDVLSRDGWDNLIRVNLTGAFLMIHAVLPGMRRNKGGLIVNIASIAGIRASVLGGAAYTASKFGMVGLGGVVAQEEAKHGIRCTSICPGEIETPILDERPQPVTAEHRARILQPEDVADAVLFVARLPPRAHVPELIIKPTSQGFA